MSLLEDDVKDGIDFTGHLQGLLSTIASDGTSPREALRKELVGSTQKGGDFLKQSWLNSNLCTNIKAANCFTTSSGR